VACHEPGSRRGTVKTSLALILVSGSAPRVGVMHARPWMASPLLRETPIRDGNFDTAMTTASSAGIQRYRAR